MAENDFTKGYQSIDPKTCDAPNDPSGQPYEDCGYMAEAYKKRWKTVDCAYPFGTAKNGGGGGGE